jgi:pilus assembly protein CpaD
MTQGFIRNLAGKKRRVRALFATPFIALSLGACAVDRTVVSTIPQADYRETHPVQLVEAPTTLDVYPAATRMDRETHMRLKEFAQGFRANGVGQIEILLPQGAPNGGLHHDALPAIRKALASGGATGYVSVGGYPGNPGDVASPIKLAYRALRARVPHACGDWPEDLFSGSSVHNWRNSPYWNFGCATQNTLAMQVADPRDLAAPRAEAAADVEMRRLRIEKVRAGTDPGANWKTANTNIGGVGN